MGFFLGDIKQIDTLVSPMVEKIRIQKLLSMKGICSRRQAETYLREGRLSINDQQATLGDKASHEDLIALDGDILEFSAEEKKVVIAFFKPKGVECTMSRIEGSKTLADYDFGVGRVFCIGRLDKDSQGLLLLTNDGDLCNKLAHPKYQKEKEYLVSVRELSLKAKSSFENRHSDLKDMRVKFDGKSLNEKVRALEEGVLIDEKKTSPCKIRILEENVLQFMLTEGRNRQIRKMCEAVNLQVLELLRVRIGKLNLGEMKSGKWRVLSGPEIDSLRKN